MMDEYTPTRFMLESSHYDEQRADYAVNFIQCLSHTKGIWAEKPFELLPWQEEIIRDLFGTLKPNGYRQFNTAYIEIPKKNGKCLVRSTLLPTPGGWVTMGDTAVGDRVFDDNGNPCHVVAKSEIITDEDVFRITFRDGTFIDAGENHLWNVQVCNNGKREKIMTSRQLFDGLTSYRDRHKGTADEKRSPYRIPVSPALQLPDTELPVDPYLYGYWLGNGTSDRYSVTVSDADRDEFVGNIPYSIYSERTQPGSHIICYRELKPILVDNFREKAIHPEYLRSSEQQRWELLQGLMDSDGCISTVKSQSIYVSTIKGLAESVRELLWSLGIKNAMTETPSSRCGIPTGETLYQIRFTSFNDQPTTKLHRKSIRKRERVKATRSCFHYIEKMECLGKGIPMQCIQVDSPSHLYLAGPSMVPTHNSELAAAVALLLTCGDGEERAEVYGCASDRQQASIVFDVAADMVRMCPALSKRVKILASQKRLVFLPTNSFYQVLSSDAYSKHGFNIHGVVYDELHSAPDRKLFDVMTKGSGDARTQPMYFLITTAGTDTHSICYEMHKKAKDLLEGRKHDPTFYPVIYGADEGDDWTDPEVWKKANPSLGITIAMEKAEAACQSAKENPAEENTFRQLRLDQWVKQSVRWMPMEKWDECAGRVDPYELEGRPCYAGLDLSSTSDLTTLVLVFPPAEEDEPYTVLPFFWLPEETLPLRVRRDHVMYDLWEKQKFLNTTEGNVVHYGYIEQFICGLGERYNIREIAYDRWNATQMVQNLEGDGFTMIPFGQGFRDMSPPSKELMRIVLEKKLNHGGHPILRWNFDNVYVRTDPAGNIKPDKEKSTEKIDGAVALIMALDRAMKNGNGGVSVYDDRGFLTLGD